MFWGIMSTPIKLFPQNILPLILRFLKNTSSLENTPSVAYHQHNLAYPRATFLFIPMMSLFRLTLLSLQGKTLGAALPANTPL